jgi:hypothetical protein
VPRKCETIGPGRKPLEMQAWRWAKICALFLGASCAAPKGTEVLVRVENDGRAAAPTFLRFSWLECRTFLEHDTRVPTSGELSPAATPLASIIVRLDPGAPTKRGIMIKGISGSDLVVSLGTAVVDVQPGVSNSATVRLYPVPEGARVDGVPDSLDWCQPAGGSGDAAPADATLDLARGSRPDAGAEPDGAVSDGANAPPVVSAGADLIAGRAGVEVALHGQVSDDGRPRGVLTSRWSQVSGPGPALFSDDADPNSKVTLPLAGLYIFRLTASDGALQSQAQVRVTVLTLESSLAGLWHFDEGAGAVAADSSGGGNDASLIGARWGEGRLGTASLDCSGAGGRAVVPDPANRRLDFGAGDFTMSAWVRTTSRRNTPNVIVKWPLQGNTGLHAGSALGLIESAVAQFKAFNGTDTVSVEGVSVADGRWHHLLGRKTTGLLVLYVDGQAVGRRPHTLVSLTNNEPLQIGGFGNSSSFDFDGLIDEVSMWSRALTDQEIAALASGVTP